MKKLFVLLLALVVVSGAFAQLTFAGYDKASVSYTGESKVAAYSDEIRFNLSANDKDGNYGFSGRFQGNSGGTMAAFTTKYMYGWAKFFGGMVKLSAGKINEGGFQFGANEANNMGGNVNSNVDGLFTDIRTQSFEVTLAPMPGLNAALIFTPSDTITGTDMKYLVSYSVEKLVNVKAEVAFNSTKKARAQAGVEYVGVENLSAVVGGKMSSYFNDATDATKQNSYMGVYSIVGYTMDKLFLEGAALVDLQNNVLAKKGMFFEGNVEYTMDTYSVRGFFGYAKKGTVSSGYAPAVGDTVVDASILGGMLETPAPADAWDQVNTYKVGAEVSFPIGGGELNAGLAYADKSKLEIPVYLKIAF